LTSFFPSETSIFDYIQQNYLKSEYDEDNGLIDLCILDTTGNQDYKF